LNKYEIIKKIEDFAPLELAESWDCSGWIVETERSEINKIMLCLTVTDDVVKQAIENNCDMIISHHPLFFVKFSILQDVAIDIYCAHTNLDRTNGGTTDTLVKKLGETLVGVQWKVETPQPSEFLRFVETKIKIDDLISGLKNISPNLRYVNNFDEKTLRKIAFCAGSGTEFIQNAKESGADTLITGDLKFHTALESPIVVFDIGHFESEILVLPVFEQIIGNKVEFVYAKEKSPFRHV
jgi:dinuclear metal center YbgI/SA1388 family protein